MKTIAIEVLLAAGVLLTLLSVLGMLRMRDPYQRLHYMSPPASLSALFFAIAIFSQEGLKPVTFKALFIVLVLTAMNSIVTHETARAFRINEVDDWSPADGEEVPIKTDDELVRPEASA